MPAKKEGFETLGVRLHQNTIHTIKIVAARRKKTASDLVTDALALWWPQQPEAKTEGPLFPSTNAEASNLVATPKAEGKEPKVSKKEAGDKEDFTKAPKAGAKKSKS